MFTTQRFRKALIPAAASLLCSSAVWAQDAPPAPQAAPAAEAPAAEPAPAAAPAAGSAASLGTVSVKGSKQPYRNLSATGATKNDALIKDLPMSVRVINAEVLEDAGAESLAEALDLSSGISRQSNLGGLWDSYAMRGFTGDPNFGSDYMVNGFNSSRGYNGVRDTVNAASVEVLKGPSSALYGRGEPGGTVNITTKKPLFQPEYTLEFGLGSWSTKRIAADLTGPLGETLAYRLNIAAEGGDSYRDTVHYERYLVSPSFVWMASPDTTVSYEIEAIKQRAPFDRGVVAVNGELGVVPVSNFYGEPSDGSHVVESLGHQVFVQHYFNDDWSLQTGLSYRDSSLKGTSSEVRPYNALVNGTTLRRLRRDRDNNATDLSGRFEVLGKLATGSVKHNLLVGVDAYRFDDGRRQFRVDPPGTTYGIDLMNPQYGLVTAGPMTLNTWTEEAQRQKGVYVQDQLEFTPQWKALFGVRYDSYDQTIDNRRLNTRIEQSLSATSPRVGLVYQPTNSWSFYATAAKSFRPNSGVSRDQEAFPAEEGKSVETGAKFDSPDGRISSTLAIYKISKNNVLTPDPIDPNNYNMAAGEVESKGVELDVSGEILPGLRASFAYAYTDAQVTEDNADLTGVSLVGRQLANVPKHSATVLLIQAFKLGDGMATLGGGLSYVGEREGSVAPFSQTDLFKLPSYTTAKLLASYAFNRQFKLSLDVDNLFDREHYTSSYSQYWVFPGTERKFTLTAQYKF